MDGHRLAMSQNVKIIGETPSAVAWIANDSSAEGGFAVLVRRGNDFLPRRLIETLELGHCDLTRNRDIAAQQTAAQRPKDITHHEAQKYRHYCPC